MRSSVFLYFSLNIFRVIKSRRMIWVGHVACMGRKKNGVGTILMVRPEGRYHLEGLGIDGRLILKCTLIHFNIVFCCMELVNGLFYIPKWPFIRHTFLFY